MRCGGALNSTLVVFHEVVESFSDPTCIYPAAYTWSKFKRNEKSSTAETKQMASIVLLFSNEESTTVTARITGQDSDGLTLTKNYKEKRALSISNVIVTISSGELNLDYRISSNITPLYWVCIRKVSKRRIIDELKATGRFSVLLTVGLLPV